MRGTSNFVRVIKASVGLGAGSAALIYCLGLGVGQQENDSSDGTRRLSWVKVYAAVQQSINIQSPIIKWDDNWDRREPANLIKPTKRRLFSSGSDETDNKDYESKIKSATPKASRHLFLIRHGQYNMDSDNDAGRTLTQLGIEQAASTGRRLKELGFLYDIMIYSTMTRATQTAREISKSLPGVPMDCCGLIREGAPYPPEPPSRDWKPEVKQFYEDGARIEAGFRKHFHRASPKQEKDSYEVIVCHANVIRYYVCRALQLPPEAWLRMSLHHGSITWVVIRPSGRVGLRTLGDVGHMVPDMMTTS